MLKQISTSFQTFSIKNLLFPPDLKLRDVTPYYKKKSKSSKDIYRPISILPNISEIYERSLYNKMLQCFDNILSKYHKVYSLQHCRITMIQRWHESIDKGGALGALLNDLSKTFHCLPHELLTAKRHA